MPEVAGTWDDHDMGEDNADKMYQYKHGELSDDERPLCSLEPFWLAGG